MAAQARGGSKASIALDRLGEHAGDQGNVGRVGIGEPEAAFAAGLDLGEHKRCGVPGESAVRLGFVGRNLVSGCARFADRRLGLFRQRSRHDGLTYLSPGSTELSTWRAVSLMMLPSRSSPLASVVANLRICSKLRCGGSGGTSGSVFTSSTTGTVERERLVPGRAHLSRDRRRRCP